jgi:hypothetical protein
MDFPKTREEKSVSDSLDWVVFVTEIEMELIRKSALNGAKDIFLRHSKITNAVSTLLLQLPTPAPFSGPRQIENQKDG